MDKQQTEIWIGHYRLTDRLNHNQLGIALGYADSADSFTHLINAYCTENNTKHNSQLAPLPLKKWIQRHGMQGDYWQLAQQLSASHPFIFVPTNKLSEQAPIAEKNYLISQSETIAPLDAQRGSFFPYVVPPKLNDDAQSFFHLLDWYADYKDEPEAPKKPINDETKRPNYYMVFDGSRSFFFPTLFKDGLPTRCLYTGDTYEKIEEASPYFVQIEAGVRDSRDFIKRLFTQHESEMSGLWDLNPNIFIRSYHDFDTVYNHMRKFTHLQESRDTDKSKWYFFRYYDPAVLCAYLQKLSSSAERLATLFGVKNGESIIDAYATRVNNDFNTFTLSDLPSDTDRAKIELGEFEKNIFKSFSQEKFFHNTIKSAVEKEFPNHHFTEEQLLGYFKQFIKLEYKLEGSLIALVKSACYLANTEYQITDILNEVKEEYGNLTETDFSTAVYNKSVTLG